MKTKSRIKLFTHNDLDGAGCGVILYTAFPHSNIDMTICSYNNVEEKIKNFFNNKKAISYEKIYITDLCIKKENVIEKIKKFKDENENIEVIIIDHHKDSEYINEKYKEISYIDSSNNESATMLTFKYLVEKHDIKFDSNTLTYAKIVSDYDTWAWANMNNDTPEKLNLAYGIMINSTPNKKNIELYIKEQIDLISDGKIIDVLTLNKVEEIANMRNKWFEKKNKSLRMYKDEFGDTFGLVLVDSFSVEYISVLGEKFCKANLMTDYIVFYNVDGYAMSYRTIKDNIKVNEKIGRFGGGGHEKAAGSPQAMRKNIHDMIALFLK